MARLADGIASAGVLDATGATRTFLCPALLDTSDCDALSHDLPKLLDLMIDIPRRLFDGDVAAMCQAMGIGSPMREAIIATCPQQEVPLGRADLMHDGESFKLLEFNVHSRLGGLENAQLVREVLKIPFFQEFINEYRLSFIDSIDGVAKSLWKVARAWGAGKRPVVAVMDWPTTFPFFFSRRMSVLLNERGFDAFCCHVGQASMYQGTLVVADRPVDIVYRMFLIQDLEESPQSTAVIFDAVRAGAAVLVMGFAAELIGNKGTLALLSDPSNEGRFSTQEQALIDRYIPWTRLVRLGQTQWRGQEVNLPAFAWAAQSKLVLKPILGRGGQGVMLGCASTPQAWRAALEGAVNGEVTHVLQERIRPRTERLAWATSAGIQLEEVVLNWGVFVAGGRYNGSIVVGGRPDSHPVFNVGQGAALGCCLHQTPACQ